MLARTYRLKSVPTIVELSVAARAAGCLCLGVAGYAAAFIGIQLRKSKKLQMSNWEAKHLTHEQQCYAATDAYVYCLALDCRT